MSALGHKRTFCNATAMSALPPKADIGTQSWNVRFVPKADIPRCGTNVAGKRDRRLPFGKPRSSSRSGNGSNELIEASEIN